MKRKHSLFFLLAFLVWLPLAFAAGDEIEMKDGSSLRGDIITQNQTQIYLNTPGGLKQIDFVKIKTIHFGPGSAKKSEVKPPSKAS